MADTGDENACVGGICKLRIRDNPKQAPLLERQSIYKIGEKFSLDVPLIPITEEEEAQQAPTSLEALVKASKTVVLAALQKLNTCAKSMQSNSGEPTVLATVNLDDCAAARKVLNNSGLDQLQHFAVDQTTRARLKACLGMHSVPFMLVLYDGYIAHIGPPTNSDLERLKTRTDPPAPNGTPLSVVSGSTTNAVSSPSPPPVFDLNADF